MEATQTKLQTYLAKIDACPEARTWVGDRTAQQAWVECERGDWLVWILTKLGHDTKAIGFWCAERARQNALRVLPDSPARTALAACAPIVDRESALIARDCADIAYTAAAADDAASAAVYAASSAASAAATYAARAAAARAYAASAAASAAVYAADGAAAAAAAADAAYATADAADAAAYAAGAAATAANAAYAAYAAGGAAAAAAAADGSKFEIKAIADYVRSQFSRPALAEIVRLKAGES
jgi:hypothetical protein